MTRRERAGALTLTLTLTLTPTPTLTHTHTLTLTPSPIPSPSHPNPHEAGAADLVLFDVRDGALHHRAHAHLRAVGLRVLGHLGQVVELVGRRVVGVEQRRDV